MKFEQLLLLEQVKVRKLLDQRPMRPAILVNSIELVVPRQTQDLANGDMHEILLFFLRKMGAPFAQFLYAN